MTPFCSSKAGGLHDTKTVLGPRTLRVKFSGGAVGTVVIKTNEGKIDVLEQKKTTKNK